MVSPNAPEDLPLPPGATEAVAGDILLENAKRFAARMNRTTGFSQPLRTPSGRRVERIVGLGNPLLDLSTSVDPEFLKQYGLAANGACVFRDELRGVFDFLRDEADVMLVPGGSCLNSLRVAQWLTKNEAATTYLGTVGLDAYGEDLRREAQCEGLVFPKLAHPQLPTGTCAVLICDQDRSLIANLGASCHFTASILESNPEVKQAIASAGVFYIEGFFFNASPEAIYKLAAHATTEQKIFALNMSAEFVPGLHRQHFLRLMPYTHFLFGNAAEGRAFATAMEWDVDEALAEARAHLNEMEGVDAATMMTAAIAMRLSTMHMSDDLRSRTVVLTQGAEPTVVATRGLVSLYTPPPIDSSDIVDTNGSGDAFVGGFLARLATGACLKECVHFGHRSAKELLKTSGCTLPETTDLLNELSELDKFTTMPQPCMRMNSTLSSTSQPENTSPRLKHATFAADVSGDDHDFGVFSSVKLPPPNGAPTTPQRTRSLSLSCSAQTVMNIAMEHEGLSPVRSRSVRGRLAARTVWDSTP